MRNLVLHIPPRSQHEGFKDLREVGYDKLDMSMAVESAWNEPANEFVLKDFTFSGVDVGSISIRGTIGNFTKDILSSDIAVAGTAALGLTAKSLLIEVDNKGGVERGFALAAKKQARRPDDVRKDIATAAAVMLPAVLGSSEGAKAISGAVAKFLVRPGSLSISATARDRGGLGIADFIAARDNPVSLFDKLDVSATVR